MAIAAPLLRLENIALTFGGKPLLEGVFGSVHQGDRIALVGRNGSGKSTLMKIAAGLVDATTGDVITERNVTTRYLPQSPDLSGHASLHDYAVSGLGPLDDPYRADRLLDDLGLDPARSTTGLSGGEARRAALARTLAPSPDILFLDEPTNHLDLPAIEWLESELARVSSAVVLISHDRRFLDTLTRRTWWVDRGELRERNAGFAGFEEWRDTTLEEEERDLHKLKRKIVREEHWVTFGVSGRRKRNMRRLGELSDLRKQFRDHERAPGSAKLEASDSRTSGKLVIEATDIARSIGERTLIEGFSLRIHRGDRIGIIGPNGAGKTTLIRMLTGETAPDAGTVRLGTALEIALLDQGRAALDPAETLEHFLTDGRGQSLVINGEQRHVMSYMKDFLFAPEQARTPVGNLSGGEKARLMLAKLLSKPANLLILDEPTNDLDMETLDLLQELVGSFDGTVLLVSHDRDFLDRTVNAVIAPDPEKPGRWITYAGGYSDMVAQRRAAQPAQEKRRDGKPAETSVGVVASAKNTAKLSFKFKHALETLPREIDALQSEIATIESKLADPALYASDPASFERLSQSLTKKQELLAAKEDLWLEAEMAREEASA